MPPDPSLPEHCDKLSTAPVEGATAPVGGPARVVGVLLAAGAGRRAGGPKALRHDGETSWLRRSLRVLADGGCEPLIVVLGAGADQAQALLDHHTGPDLSSVQVVVAQDWADGMAASLRTGLAQAATLDVDAALVHLVDLPDVGADVVRRVIAQTSRRGRLRDQLARAQYDQRPGHPVLIGLGHLPALLPTLSGDRGAASYLLDHDTYGVQCGDLADGTDRDRPDEDRPGS